MSAKDHMQARLLASHPSISTIRLVIDTAGQSAGVLHHGEAIHCANFEYRDVKTMTRAEIATLSITSIP